MNLTSSVKPFSAVNQVSTTAQRYITAIDIDIFGVLGGKFFFNLGSGPDADELGGLLVT
jgi:hypothetical protein